jgi:5'-deoxynucleotidase YfbR-like HD superfamily hydrolase
MQHDYITFSGTKIYIQHPDATQLTMDDIRRPMLNMRRYNSQVDVRLISHSLLVAFLCARHGSVAAAYGAAHDAAETIIHDIIHGIKQHLPEYHAIEQAWDRRLFGFFGLDPDGCPRQLVKQADQRALLIEMQATGHAGFASAYQAYGEATGGPVKLEELNAFLAIITQSPEDQWKVLLSLIEQGSKEQRKESWQHLTLNTVQA